MNIIAFRNDRFGEFLLTIPALAALKEGHHDCKISLVIDSYVKPLAENIECVDEIIIWDNRKHSLREIISFAKKLRNKKFYLSIVFNPSKEFNIVSFLAGIKKRIGYSRKWAFLITNTVEDKKHLAHKHEVQYNLDLAKLAGCAESDPIFPLNVNDACANILFEEFNISASDNLVVIHPFTSDNIKQWSLDKFKELIYEIVKEPGTRVIVVGGGAEPGKLSDFFSDLNGNIINLIGKTDLSQLTAILKKSKVLVSCDSGPMHLAASVGTPVIAIFRSDIISKSAKRWGPWGKGHTVIEKKSLSDITVDEVFEAIKNTFLKL